MWDYLCSQFMVIMMIRKELGLYVSRLQLVLPSPY